MCGCVCVSVCVLFTCDRTKDENSDVMKKEKMLNEKKENERSKGVVVKVEWLVQEYVRKIVNLCFAHFIDKILE